MNGCLLSFGNQVIQVYLLLVCTHLKPLTACFTQDKRERRESAEVPRDVLLRCRTEESSPGD
jgi:hypothetical protein